MEDPILAHFNPNWPRRIHTDSSGYAAGIILACVNDKGQEQVIAYGSRLFKNAENHYSISEKELLAILFAIKKFRAYVVGTHFEIYTDHTALQSAFKIKDTTGRLFRMKMHLLPYDCVVLYRKGKAHTNVDALSRLIDVQHEPLNLPPFEISKEAAVMAIESNQTTKKRKTPDVQELQLNAMPAKRGRPRKTLEQPSTKPNQLPDKRGRKKESQPIAECENVAETEHTMNTDQVEQPEPAVELKEDDTSEDIFKNKHLMHFVKSGKHSPVLTPNSMTKIENLAKHYHFDNPVMYYRINVDTPKFPYIMPPNETVRQQIICGAHALGHFQSKSTLDRIKERYYWPDLAAQVKEHIEKCHPCIRHEVKHEIHHPAIALPINCIFDRCGIDLIGPLTETHEGHKHICVITEYLTKTGFARPIKGKSAEDVAPVLWEYISLYGPPKELLSDCGTEFLNATIKQITTTCGIEHRVTSPYRPETNGLTERFNQTLVRALKKHCEDDPKEWNKWLPFVILAYNTRKNSTTGFSPYNLMFGRLMNHFEDYRKPSESLSLTKRLDEIKQNFENAHEIAKENIEKKQKIQKRQQDSTHRVTQEPLDIGQLVTIKSLQIKGKLQPVYNGIYRITGTTRNGNYLLETETGKPLKSSFISSRLKKVSEAVEEDDPNAHCEVEQILAHSRRKGKYSYLVKWKNKPESENSWEPEENFDTPMTIEEYWSNINKTPTVQMAYTKFSAFVNLISTMLILSNVIPSTTAIKVQDKFKFCELHDNKVIWDLPDSCRFDTIHTKHNQDNYAILSKKTNEVTGPGWHCSKTKKSLTTTQYLFGGRDVIDKKEWSIEVSAEDCRDMIAKRHCDNRPMYGDDNDQYWSSGSPPPHVKLLFSVWYQYTFEWTECEAYARHLEAENANAKILLGEVTLSRCLAKDLYCKTKHGMIIWDKTIINDCPYELAGMYALTKFDNVFVDTRNNKLYQATKNTTICNKMPVIYTAEGFYLTNDDRATKLTRAENTPKLIDELVMTEIDYAQFNTMAMMTKMFALTNQKMCQLYKSFVNLYSNIHDEFFTFSDFLGNEAILYSNLGQIFVPQCREYNELELIEQTKECYKDVPVLIRPNNNTSISAYLTPSRIIRKVSYVVPCKNNNRDIRLPNSKRIIEVRGNRALVIDDAQYIKVPINLQQANVTHLNFQHDQRIITNINIVKKAAEIKTIDEGPHMFHVKEDYQTELREKLKAVIDQIAPNVWETIEFICARFFSYVGFVCTTILVLFLLISYCRRRNQPIVIKPMV